MRGNAIRKRWSALLVVAGTLAVASAPVGADVTSLRLPPPAAPADYQLGGGYAPAPGVRIVSRDRTDDAAPGVYSVCYLNSFQTQAGETTWWRSHHPGLLLRDHGREVGDPNWPGEVLFDVRTAARRHALMQVQGRWIDGCARKRFAAVEPDNLDSYTRSHGLLSQRDAVAMATMVIGRSHQRHLAVAQKNTSELAPRGRAIGFDFAVAEECQVYRECDAYTSVYGKRVIEVEYSDNGLQAFRDACRIRRGRASIMLRDRDLTRPGAAAYVDRRC